MESDNQLQEMSFWDHVDALRSVLFKVAVVIIALAVGLFVAMPIKYKDFV